MEAKTQTILALPAETGFRHLSFFRVGDSLARSAKVFALWMIASGVLLSGLGLAYTNGTSGGYEVSGTANQEYTVSVATPPYIHMEAGKVNSSADFHPSITISVASHPQSNLSN